MTKIAQGMRERNWEYPVVRSLNTWGKATLKGFYTKYLTDLYRH